MRRPGVPEPAAKDERPTTELGTKRKTEAEESGARSKPRRLLAVLVPFVCLNEKFSERLTASESGRAFLAMQEFQAAAG